MAFERDERRRRNIGFNAAAFGVSVDVRGDAPDAFDDAARLAHAYSRLGGELRRFQHYLGEPLGGFTGWRPQLPVTQWSVTKR